MLGGAQRERRVLLDDDDRHPAVVHLLQRAEDLAHDQRRKPERRLVEQEHARLRHHRATERQHLLLTAGERSGLLLAALEEAREELEHAGEVALRDTALHPRAEAQVVEHRERS